MRADLSLMALAERVAAVAPELEGRSHTALGRLETHRSAAVGLGQLRVFVEATGELGIGPREALDLVKLLSNPSAAWAAQLLVLAQVYQVEVGVLLGLEELPEVKGGGSGDGGDG